MAPKPPSGMPLFPADADAPPASEDPITSLHEGSRHELQDDGSRTAAGAPADLRPAAPGAHAAAGSGILRQGAQGQPRRPEDPPGPGAAGQPPEPDRERSPGDRAPGTGGFFARRVGGRERPALPRRSDGLSPPSYAARVKASRTLFDSFPDDSSSPVLAPPGALSDGTISSPPGIASGNGDPTPLPACNDADAPGLGAASLACR